MLNPLTLYKEVAQASEVLLRDELELKPLTLKDAPGILAAISDSVCEDLGAAQVTDLKQARAFVRGEGTSHDKRYGIWLSPQQLIGSVGYGLYTNAGVQSAYISYWLSPSYHRRGLGKQTLKLLLEHLAAQDVDTVYADVFTTNQASRALLSSMGFTCQPIEIGEMPTILRYHKSCSR